MRMGRVRTRAYALAVAVSTCLVVLASAVTAAAAPPLVTLRGEGADGGTPDSALHSTVNVNATLNGKLASGTLDTGGRTGDIENFSHYEFTGEITCIIQKGARLIVGAFGTDAFYNEHEGTSTIEPLPGTYMQVAVIESGGHYESVSHVGTHGFASLGEHSRGVESPTPPKCKEYRSFAPDDGASWFDTLKQSPSIIKPKDGYTSTSGTVKLAGSGEAKTAVKVYEVGHKSKAIQVEVSPHGKWSLTLSGLAAGMHEFIAVAVEGSTVLSNTVTFQVA